MDTKHTPGPWAVQYSKEMPELEVVSQDGWGIALCAAGLSDGVSDANARLISAAPELLAALQATRKQLGKLTLKDGEISAAMEAAGRAICKATGAAT